MVSAVTAFSLPVAAAFDAIRLPEARDRSSRLSRPRRRKTSLIQAVKEKPKKSQPSKGRGETTSVSTDELILWQFQSEEHVPILELRVVDDLCRVWHTKPNRCLPGPTPPLSWKAVSEQEKPNHWWQSGQVWSLAMAGQSEDRVLTHLCQAPMRGSTAGSELGCDSSALCLRVTIR